MKILFLSPRIPFPPYRGDRIAAYYRMEYLKEQGHQINMAFPCFSKEDERYVPAVKKFCQEVDTAMMRPPATQPANVFSLLANKPQTLAAYYSRELHDKLKAKLVKEHFDIVYVHSSVMAQYVRDVKGVKKIMDFADSYSQRLLQYSLNVRTPFAFMYRREARRLQAYEKAVCGEFDEVIASSNEQEKLFHSYIQDKEFSVIPGGVDPEYFSYQPEEYHAKEIVFVGVMNHLENIDAVMYFVKNILPLIRVRAPDVTLYIVGANPVAAVKRLGFDRHIIVTGAVGDVRPYLKNACAYVAPMRISRGVKGTILQAMAVGVPVVSTSKGNEGINAVNGESIYIADEFQAFTNYVIKLITDPRVRMRISHSARSFVKERFQWNKSMTLFESILQGAHLPRRDSEFIYG